MGCVDSKSWGNMGWNDNSESWGSLITCESVGLLLGKFKCLMTYPIKFGFWAYTKLLVYK